MPVPRAYKKLWNFRNVIPVRRRRRRIIGVKSRLVAGSQDLVVTRHYDTGEMDSAIVDAKTASDVAFETLRNIRAILTDEINNPDLRRLLAIMGGMTIVASNVCCHQVVEGIHQHHHLLT